MLALSGRGKPTERAGQVHAPTRIRLFALFSQLYSKQAKDTMFYFHRIFVLREKIGRCRRGVGLPRPLT